MGTQNWLLVKAAMKRSLGKGAYESWIEPLELVHLDGVVAELQAPTKFIGEYVSRHFGDRLIAECATQGLGVERLQFTTRRMNKAKADKPAKVEAKHNNPFDLNGQFRFDNFVVGKANELAHAAAKRIASGGEIAFNPLFIHGGVGLGKTHLMNAIAWEMKERNAKRRVLYLSAEQFMYRFVQALRFKDTMSFKEMFRSVDVLMVDDFQFIAGKGSTQEEFFHTFNALISENKQVVLSADRAPVDIEGLEERIKSRLQSGLVVDVHPADYELRLGILQSKYEERLGGAASMVLEEGVIEFLARKITENARVLEGALNRLLAVADVINQPITIEIAKQNLAEILRASERKVSIDEILRKVTDHYGLNMSDMLSPRRTRSIARPRQVAMYLAKTMTEHSLPEIGRQFGKRDHTTVIHAVKKVEELQISDTQIVKDIEVLRRQLEG